MSIPNVTITVQDGGLGILPNTAGNTEVTVGVASGAVANQLYSFGDVQTVQSTLGQGPGAEALALKLATGGGGSPQLFVQPALLMDGAASSVTKVGTGTGTVAVGFGPAQQISIAITTTGQMGTAKFTYQIGTGAVSAPVSTTASPFAYIVPGTMTTLTFTDGGVAWTAGDTIFVSATGTVTTGSNTGNGTVAQVSQPFDTYAASVIPSTTGGFSTVPNVGATTATVSQTAYLTYALDLNPVTGSPYSSSAPFPLPSNGKYAIANSGLALTLTQPTLVVDIHTTGGALGTMKFRYNLNGSGFSADQLSVAGSTYTFAIPNSNLSITFADATFNVGVTYTWTSTGAFTLGGGGVAADNKISLTSTAFVAGDVYSFSTITSGYSSSALNTTLSALMLQPQLFSFVHVVGTPSPGANGGTAAAADALTLANQVDSTLTAALSQFRFVRGLVECPTVGTTILSASAPIADTADTDTVLISTFQNFVSTRTAVGAGDAIVTGLLSGRFLRRNAGYLVAARVAQVAISEDLAFVGRGALPFVSYLFRDEAKTPALDAARFSTLRTFQGLQGYYITNARLMASSISDFQLLQFGRVMDAACVITRQALLPFLSGSVQTNRTTGYIAEKDAQVIEAAVSAKLNAGIVAPGDASAATVQLSRTTNLNISGAEPVTVRIVSLGYLKQISANIGFYNPALSA